jgi:hypothetical protein
MAFQELLSLRVGCLTACSKGSHHLCFVGVCEFDL